MAAYRLAPRVMAWYHLAAGRPPQTCSVTLAHAVTHGVFDMIPVFAHRNKLHQIAAMLRAPFYGIVRTA